MVQKYADRSARRHGTELGETLERNSGPLCPHGGAKGANRTRDTALFRRVLYRLSYLGTPFWRAHRVFDFLVNRDALGTLATLMGLEPTTFAVTGRRSNQLSYSAKTRTPTPEIGHGWD